MLNPILTTNILIDRQSDPYLHLLLRSLPSQQYRPGITPPPDEIMMEDEIRQTPAPPSTLTVTNLSATKSAGAGMLAKLGSLFTRLISGVKVEQIDVDLADDEETVVGDTEDELEVEYMIVAEKCVPPGALGKGKGKERRRRRTKPSSLLPLKQHRPKPLRRTRSRASTPGFRMIAPPVIRPRRKQQVKRIEEWKKRSRGTPGFR